MANSSPPESMRNPDMSGGERAPTLSLSVNKHDDEIPAQAS